MDKIKKSKKETRLYFGEVLVFVFVSLFVLCLLSGCSGPRMFVPPEQVPDDRRSIPEPDEKEINIYADNVDKLVAKQIGKFFDTSQQVRKVLGKPKQAYNVDAFGDVANSSWFTNRNGMKRMTEEEISRGPNTGVGPDTSGTWTIIRAKAEGVTPGFSIEDRHGERYLIKFDPKGYSEMATGAEVVSTKLLYAAGYNVPENYIVYFHPRILKLGGKVKFTDKKGRKRYMTENDLEELLDRIEHLPDGRIRVAASRFLQGNLKGPFRYENTVRDDPNDFIPHQHRRELRALRVVAAWLNHFDTKASNTLDVYVEEGYVKHYLIDFGSTLGSQGDEPMPPYIGFEGSFDLFQTVKQMCTLGFLMRPWEKADTILYPSVGRFHNRDFHPQRYKFILPNPAFQKMTKLDGYWGAKLVMSFTDEQIEAAVAQGRYSDPEAEAYLIQILTERRDIIGRYWFRQILPLEGFELRHSPEGTSRLCFVDLAVDTGLESAEEVQYRYRMSVLAGDYEIMKSQSIAKTTCIPLPSVNDIVTGLRKGNSMLPSERQLEVTLQMRRAKKDKWSKWVKIYLACDEASSELSLLGIERQD